MSAPANSRKTKGKRWYAWNPPGTQKTERYWSVTTIIDGGIPKPALIGWAAKMTALYAITNLDLLKIHVDQDRLEDGSLPPFDPDDGKPRSDGCVDAYELLTKSRFKSSKKAADLGTEIHECIEARVLGKPAPEWGPDVAPYMERFIDFLDTMQPTIEASEASVYSRRYKYAGTLDMLLALPSIDQRWIVDVKTGGVWPEAALQQAAYANADFIGRPDGKEEPMPKVDGAAVLHLQPDWWVLHPVRIDKPVLDAFLYAREVFRWQEEIAKSAIGRGVSSIEALQQVVGTKAVAST